MTRVQLKDGATGYKQVRIKVFSPQGRHKTFIYRAPAGRAYDDHGIADLLHQIAEQVDRETPEHQYRLVPLGPNVFNIIPCAPGHEIVEAAVEMLEAMP